MTTTSSTETAMMRETAERFFHACETGQGWEVCNQHCHADASFSAQADALAGIDTLQAYTDWMKGLLTPVPDGRYEIRSFAVDSERATPSPTAYSAAPTPGTAGPCPRPDGPWRPTTSTSWSSKATGSAT
jgi:hypothetical protein